MPYADVITIVFADSIVVCINNPIQRPLLWFIDNEIVYLLFGAVISL